MTGGLLIVALLSQAPGAMPSTDDVATPIAPSHVGSTPLDPEREARVQRLGKGIRCPVCQGLSVADSPSASARAQLDKIRELVVDGRSDQEIEDYFVARYGEWALLKPRVSGQNTGLWFGPLALLVIGMAIILSQVKKRGKVAAPGPVEGAQAPAAAADDEYLRAVRADLKR
jgi:cytochrome c-type biogenesis protein CcmH